MTMISATDMLNAPVEFEVAGKKIPLKRLSIGEILALSEAAVRKASLDDARDMANGLAGKEKLDFLRASMADLPKGAVLMTACEAWLNSLAGVTGVFVAAAKKANPSWEASSLAASMTEQGFGELALAVRYAVGSDLSEDKPDSPKTQAAQ